MVAAELVRAGMMTVSEACDFLRIKKTSLYALMGSGRLPSCLIGGSRRIPTAAVEQLAAESLQAVLTDGRDSD